MKRFLVILGIGCLLISFSFNSYSKDLKIGYVDIFKVFNDYQKTKEYDKQLEKVKSAREKELDQRKKEIDKLQQGLSLLKEKEQNKQKTKITEALKDYRNSEREIFVDLKKQRDEKMKEIVEDINVVIDGYAKKNNFDFVVNANAILYGDKNVDITVPILRAINKKYKIEKKK